MSKELINRRIINVARAVVVAIALSSAFSIQYIWDELDSVKIKMDSQQRRIDAQYQVILKQAQLIDTLIRFNDKYKRNTYCNTDYTRR